MLRILSRVIWPAALLATVLLWNSGCVRVDSRPERIIAYVNDDDSRGTRLMRMLQDALEGDVSDSYRARIILFPADMSDPKDIRATLERVVRSRPAAIIATNSEAAAIAKSLTREIPIIFGSREDPVRLRLVDSLARPGANATGFTYFVPIDQKRLELMRELAPRVSRVGILIDHWWLEESNGRAVVEEAMRHGVEAHLFRAETTAELAAAIATPEAKRMEAWYVPLTLLPFDHPAEVVALLGATAKPVVYPATSFVESGGLVSYQQSLPMEESSRLIANMVRLVLEGVPAGDIPVERPKSFELAVNLQAARRLGLHLPPSYLKRADRVIGQ